MRRTRQRADDREAQIAAVAAECLSSDPPPGRALVVGDLDGAVERALPESTAWRRLALDGAVDGRGAAPWPDDGAAAYAAAVLRLPGGWAAFTMALHAACARLPEDAPVWIYGGNDEGVTSAPGHLDGLIDRVEVVGYKRRSRVLLGRRTAAPARGALADWAETAPVALPGVAAPVALTSWPGLFAHGLLAQRRIDPGTQLLLEALPEIKAGARVLDFGCGAGAISRTVRERAPESVLTMLDVDALALHAAAINVPGAETRLSDGWSGVAKGERFDLVLSNPPLHRGRAEDFAALTALVAHAKDHLRRGGALVAVAQRTSGMGALVKDAFHTAEVLAETPQFQVWRGA